MERKHLVKSAKYWFDAARTNESQGAKNAVLCMENAYNHVENALAWLLERATPEVKAEFQKING